MPPSLREFKAKVPTSHVQPAGEYADLLRAAAVSSEKLTGQPEWDSYLSKLQAMLEEAQVAAAGWLERCGQALEDKDVRIAQFNYQACKARVTTLQEVMLLPQAIIEAHRGA